MIFNVTPSVTAGLNVSKTVGFRSSFVIKTSGIGKFGKSQKILNRLSVHAERNSVGKLAEGCFSRLTCQNQMKTFAGYHWLLESVVEHVKNDKTLMYG